MKIQNILYWVFATIAIASEIVVTGYGVSWAIAGQNCRDYADLGCAFGVMFSFIVIPYGLINLILVGVTSLPFKLAQILGGIFSTLSALTILFIFCTLVFAILSAPANESKSISMDAAFIFPFFLFLGGASMLGAGVMGVLRSRN